MTVDVNLEWNLPGTDPNATPSPALSLAPGASPGTPKTFVIDAATIHSWITFGFKADGTYGPTLDPSKSQPYLTELSKKIATPPIEPDVVYGADGKAASLKEGKDGIGVDVIATTRAVEEYLDRLVAGTAQTSTVTIATSTLTPKITLETLKDFVRIGDGTWTTEFYPGESNGNGVNIRLPSTLLNGTVVQPGQQFSFLNAVGPIDLAHGYKMGGVISGGKSDHTGAMGGGICSASTTMFNAAMRAGLQIDERHAHFYYIDRYPVGLDATVYSNGWQTWDLKWTNDTPDPIIIRSSTKKIAGGKSTITVELWSLPIERDVLLNVPVKTNVSRATDSTKYVTSLAPGKSAREEFPSDGYDVTRTRTVTDATGKVIHENTWNSHYSRVDGILWVGVAPTPTPTAAVPPLSVPAMTTPSLVTVSRPRAG
jgi:vancomycin resistance protein YoaR